MKRMIWLIMIIFIACGRQEEAPREEVEVKPVKTIVLQRKKIRKEVVGNSDILPMNKTAQIIKSGGELIVAPRLRKDHHTGARGGQGHQAGDDLRPHPFSRHSIRGAQAGRRDPDAQGQACRPH